MVSNPWMALRQPIATCWLLLLFLSQGGATDIALARATQTSGFGFRFQVGDCLTETFDSFTGVFTKNLGGEPERLVTAQLSLSESQMNTIHQTIEEIRFVDYPSQYRGVPSGLKVVTTFGPASTYRLEVRIGARTHVVTWKDAYKPTTEEADRLRALFSMILGFIHNQPEFKQLPQPIGGCY
jgi:hypothetical protein